MKTKKSKRLITKIIYVLATLFLLTSCAGENNNGNGNSEVADTQTGNESGKTYNVGLIQFVDHYSLNEIKEAFLEKIKETESTNNITINVDYKNAQGDMSLINTICRGFVDSKVDMIVAITTPAAQGAAGVTSDIPIIFSAVTDPVGAGLVEALDKTSGNITGVSDAIDITKIFNLAEQLTPDAKTYGLIYNKGEANSVSVIADVKKYMDENGLTYVEKTVANSGEVQQVSRILLEQCDAVFAPIDNTVASAMQVLASECENAKKPVYVAADSMVMDGGFATVGVNYKVLGEDTAILASEILSGAKISDKPVIVKDETRAVVNQKIADLLGVDLSGMDIQIVE